MDKFKKVNLIFITIGLLMTIVISTIKCQSQDVPKYQEPLDDTIRFEFRDKDAINDSILVHELVRLKVKEPFIVLAQAKLETGNFTSRYYFERHNIFGFRTGQGYMHFNSWRGCVQYYKVWQTKYYKGGDYYTFLEELPYAEDVEYINKLKKICLK